MELIIDAGNSNIVFAMYDDGVVGRCTRIETRTDLSEVFLLGFYSNFLLENKISPTDIKGAAISSVVTEIRSTLLDSVQNYFGINPFELTPEVITQLPFHIPKPYEIGSDLVSNAFAAYMKYSFPVVVVDFGTALTFTVCDENGIKGVTIAPGLSTALDSLHLQTSKLPQVGIVLPDSVIGHSTTTAIQAGVLYGYIGLIKEILTRISIEMKTSPCIIATGGLSHLISQHIDMIQHIDRDLTLLGIAGIYKYF